jgi:hypothetical protein
VQVEVVRDMAAGDCEQMAVRDRKGIQHEKRQRVLRDNLTIFGLTEHATRLANPVAFMHGAEIRIVSCTFIRVTQPAERL